MRDLGEGQTWELSQGSPSERGDLSGTGGPTDEPPSAVGLRKQQARGSFGTRHLASGRDCDREPCEAVLLSPLFKNNIHLLF